MKFGNIEPYLSLLYAKAKNKFQKCIYDEENIFLKDEINIPLEDIIVIDKDIKIVFSQSSFNKYIIEVNLLLFDDSKEIGKYSYSENENEEEIDDSLVFY